MIPWLSLASNLIAGADPKSKMSWLAKSIADTLSLNQDPPEDPNDSLQTPHHLTSDSNQPSPRGVKEDLSEITQTLSRQFWGVASFLAPPPQPDPAQSDPDVVPSGIRTDLSEIGGRFRTGFSKVAGNIKYATDFLQKAVEEMNEEAARTVVGVSEDVVAFAKDLALHPETWLDFPLIQDDDDMDEEFDMSDAQQEHALAVERLAPSLASVRMELCPEHISESCFWKIYFVLLHPKLDKEVAVILSTPQVMEARALLATELQTRSKLKPDNNRSTTSVDQKDGSILQHEVSLSVPSDVPENATQNVVVSKPNASTETTDYDIEKHSPTSIDIQVEEKSATSTTAADSQTDKHPIAPAEIQIVDKSVIEVEHNDRNNDQNVQPGPSNAWDNREDEDEYDGDDWLKEETTEVGGGGASATNIPIDNDEDVSFSDLEDDDVDAPSTLKKVNDTSDKDSREWVQLWKDCMASSSKE